MISSVYVQMLMVYKFFNTDLVYLLESLFNNILIPLLYLFSSDQMLTFLFTQAEYWGVYSGEQNFETKKREGERKWLKKAKYTNNVFLAISMGHWKNLQEVPVII